MRLTALLAVCAATLAAADPRTAQIYIQPLSASSPSKPAQLAEIAYDPSTPGAPASIVSYEAPELPDDSGDDFLLRVGVYDAKGGKWTSGTTVASAENLAKGYSPHLLVTVDPRAAGAHGSEVLSVALKGVRIDAGQTRDFGPQVQVVAEARGKQPELNKPVVLSPDGKKVDEQEKTFLQK